MRTLPPLANFDWKFPLWHRFGVNYLSRTLPGRKSECFYTDTFSFVGNFQISNYQRDRCWWLNVDVVSTQLFFRAQFPLRCVYVYRKDAPWLWPKKLVKLWPNVTQANWIKLVYSVSPSNYGPLTARLTGCFPIELWNLVTYECRQDWRTDGAEILETFRALRAYQDHAYFIGRSAFLPDTIPLPRPFLCLLSKKIVPFSAPSTLYAA